jgi:hypothetical protein
MTNDVVLRDVVASDLPIFYTQQLDPDATAMAVFPSISTYNRAILFLSIAAKYLIRFRVLHRLSISSYETV